MQTEKKRRRKLTSGKIYAVILAVVVLCCMMLSVLEGRYGWEWDITVGDIYTLSEETLGVLENMDDAVRIYTLYSPGNYNKTILTLLEKYQFYCKNITVSNIDPMGDRLEIRELEDLEDRINEGALIVVSENTGRARLIDADEFYITYDGDTYFLAENRITDAIDYVTTGEYRRLLLTVGHRETDAEDIERFIKRMTMRNYIVEEYDYLHTMTAPDPETDVIISVSPGEDYTESEVQSIREFTERGGTYILLYDYAEYDESLGTILYSDTDMPQLRSLIRSFGIELGKGIIVGKDASETGFRNTTIELDPAQAGGASAVFSECTNLKKTYKVGNTAEPLLMTSENCALQYESGDGKYYAEKAPYTAAMLAEIKNGCAAVFGTSSFIGDTELSTSDNELLIDGILKKSLPGYPQNTVAPKRVATDELVINSTLVKVVLIVLVLVVLPCGILAIGIVVVRRRKSLAGEHPAE